MAAYDVSACRKPTLLGYSDAQRFLENWKLEHNNHRPHSSLQNLSLAQF